MSGCSDEGKKIVVNQGFSTGEGNVSAAGKGVELFFHVREFQAWFFVSARTVKTGIVACGPDKNTVIGNHGKRIAHTGRDCKLPMDGIQRRTLLVGMVVGLTILP
jgi:hypothetical protein